MSHSTKYIKNKKGRKKVTITDSYTERIQLGEETCENKNHKEFPQKNKGIDKYNLGVEYYSTAVLQYSNPTWRTQDGPTVDELQISDNVYLQ